MDEAASQTAITEQEPRPAEPPARRRAAWPFVALAIFLVGVFAMIGANVTLPYFAFSPGRTVQIDDLVAASGVDTHPHPGQLYLLTVTRAEVNLFGYLEARWFDSTSRLVPRDAVLPPDVDREEQRRHDLDAMEESKSTAIAVALTRLGYQVTDGAEVAGLSENSPSAGILEVGDVITAVDGTPVASTPELVEQLTARGVGDVVELTFRRGDDVFMEKVTLGRLVLDDGSERPVIGVTAGTHFQFPFDVEIDSQNIAGPSGGLMLTLGVMNLLSEDDLTRGHRVAGTGTIALDGSVGAIGGAAQKVHGAKATGAEVVFIPVDNYEEARQAAGDDVEVVAVSTIDDALAYLAGLPPV